tara:strand:+ start:396 stop:710 length:315 start_codon:yes stop_codon:yes gene_type:complete
MGSQRESVFEKKCIKELRKWPKSWWPPKVDSHSIRGIPDRIGIINGVCVALEFKRSLSSLLNGSESTSLQEFTLREIENAGGKGIFIYPENKDQVFERLKGIYK